MCDSAAAMRLRCRSAQSYFALPMACIMLALMPAPTRGAALFQYIYHGSGPGYAFQGWFTCAGASQTTSGGQTVTYIDTSNITNAAFTLGIQHGPMLYTDIVGGNQQVSIDPLTGEFTGQLYGRH